MVPLVGFIRRVVYTLSRVDFPLPEVPLYNECFTFVYLEIYIVRSYSS
jgi:hypothetical protein